MDRLNELLQTQWGAQRWIREGWDAITPEEQDIIQARMDALFKNGLPFALAHNRVLYLHAFSLLAQLEVLAIQVPLKFQHYMTSPILKARLREQLLDEIFHGLVFTKIAYLLTEPYAVPPAYNAQIETLCDFIRAEECPKMALMLLNLIGEGWIEEIFYSLERAGIAQEIFQIILNDEHRHVCEAELYREIGLPAKEAVQEKIAFLEEQLLMGLFFQYNPTVSVSTLLGVEGVIDFLQALDKKHRKQLESIALVPGEYWQFFMKMGAKAFPAIYQYTAQNQALTMTPMRQVFMTQWGSPSDPTMVGQFMVDITRLEFFKKIHPSESLTTLMLQALSLSLMQDSSFRAFLSHNKLYSSENAYTALVVKLPGCGDQLGMMVFENCHTLSLATLSARIRQVLGMMVYCFNARVELEKAYPHLLVKRHQGMQDFHNIIYPIPLAGSSVVSLSNIGACGYTQTKAPLRRNESLRMTLSEVTRHPVWNAQKETFEPRDMLPVSLSADHRIFDGNVPMPKILSAAFDAVLTQFLTGSSASEPSVSGDEHKLIQFITLLKTKQVDLAWYLLLMLQTCWVDFLPVESWWDEDLIQKYQGSESLSFSELLAVTP